MAYIRTPALKTPPQSISLEFRKGGKMISGECARADESAKDGLMG